MATFVKGKDPIPFATGYKLYRKVGDDYSLVASSTCGKDLNCFLTGGYIDANGALVKSSGATAEYTEMYSDFIPVDILANNVEETTPRCVNTMMDTAHSRERPEAAFYTKYGDYTSCVGVVIGIDMPVVGYKAEDIRTKAQLLGASYVVFSHIKYGDNQPWVCFNNDIFFILDAYKDVLTAGETHYLVVQAIGDGVNYSDSEYGGDENENPLEYTVEGNTIDITSQFVLTESRMISATDGKLSTYSGWVANENYVDISAYSEIEIKMSKTSSTGTGTGLALYDADKNFVSGIPHTDGVATYGTMIKTIQVPSNVKYIRTTYWSTSNSNYKADYGDFYCKATLK